ncbi:OmpH family outer membrane protein [Daejeonella sp.]|uniref:OmpH family outer membrane protein n=1 Tax=Daejeonella sp. TaxID=2805397 RepID=UPI00271FBCD5|nr:OmpH family outer membrane protein [Daejeonella sp.]MDO8993591.1 OmpH family outer membrane protein [Daejeonella sp.]MDP2414883.1 OmpH family outer membrane protein [Daejeonella sp.]
MKKLITSISKIAIILTLSAIVVSCNKEQTKSTGSVAASSAAAAEGIVYVNSDSLLSNYDYYKAVRDKFQEKSKKAQADLTAKGTAFQREVASYQQGAANLSAEQRATTEERLARKQQELATYNQNAGNALANEEAAENDKLYNKVSDYLKGYAKSKGYKIVLTYSKSNPAVLYADESLDVTKAVVDGLNADYKKEKK